MIEYGSPGGVEAPGLDERSEGEDGLASLHSPALAGPFHPGYRPASCMRFPSRRTRSGRSWPDVSHSSSRVPVIAEVVQLALQSGIQRHWRSSSIARTGSPFRLPLLPNPVSLELMCAGGAVVGEDVLGGRGEVLRCMPEIDQLERLWIQGGQEAPIGGRVCDGNKPQIGPEPGGSTSSSSSRCLRVALRGSGISPEYTVCKLTP